MPNIKELALAYDDAKREKERCEAALKAANQALDDAADALANEMIGMELDSFKTADATFSLTVKDYYRPNAERKDELYAALKDNGLGDIVKETVNANTLSAVMRDIVEGNGGVMPPAYGDLINVFSKTTISRRKA